MGKVRPSRRAMGLCGALLLLAAPVQAVDQGITGKKLLLKNQRKTVVISKDPKVSITGSDPVNGADSTITFAIGTYTNTYNLPASNWAASGGGTLFKYKNTAAAPGPSAVKITKLKSGLLKLVANGNALSVPVGDATIDVELRLDGGTNRYCMTFPGSGNGDTFLGKDAEAGDCPVCGDGVREGTEVCDSTDDDACPFECQSDCTCPVCGNNQTESTEQCDGTDDGQCPGLCLGDCTCNPTAGVCCDYGGTCGGTAAGICIAFGGTALAGGLQCDASGTCVAANTGSAGGCCETSGPQLCGMPSPAVCPGTFHSDSVCLPSGECAPLCQATTGGFCWFLGDFGESCDDTCVAAGRVYDDATRTFAGSGGSNANCNAVLDDLGVSLPPVSGPCAAFGGIGCAAVGGFGSASVHCLTPPTDSMSAFLPAVRVCACQ